MSDGVRLPLRDALHAWSMLLERWWPQPASAGPVPGVEVVGSVRRGEPYVGDIEIVAPAEPLGDDRLWRRIANTLDTDDQGLFAAPTEPKIGRAIKGLKPGFLAAYLAIYGEHAGRDCELPVQIFRHTPRNRGWITLMRTGPSEFGQWFLGRWKAKHGIDPSKQASIDGHLVDRAGNVIDVPDERAAFSMLGYPFVEPERRSAFMASQRRSA